MKRAYTAAILGILLPGAQARAGTVTVQGDQTVAGNQLVQSNQTVAGALVSQGPAAEVAATRFRAFGPAGDGRWIRVARIGGVDLTNAVVAGRVLAQGSSPGNQYIADFAFPGPGQGPYSPVLVEMGGATNFTWEVRNADGDHWLWFRQCPGSGFANFLYGESACGSVWETNMAQAGTVVWSSATAADARQRIRAGGMTLTSGLTLPDGTLLDARTNMTASAIIDPASGQTNMIVSGGRLRFYAPSDFIGQVTLPESVTLGTNGVSITGDRWAALESTTVAGTGAKDIAGTAPWAITGMADDAAGNRYAYGFFAGTLRAGGVVLSSGASENDRAGFVLKLDPVGRMEWAGAFPVVGHSTNGAQNESLVQIARGAVDASGNVVLAGTFRAATDFGGVTNSPSGGGDAFVVSLRPDGTTAWFRQFGGSEAAADTFVDMDIGPGGTNIVAAGAKAVSGGTDGRAVRLSVADGYPQGEWSVDEAIAHACLSGSSPVVAWGSTVSRLGGGGWSVTVSADVGDLLGTPSGDVAVFQPGWDSVGGVALLAAADGTQQWSEVGYSYGTGGSYEVYDPEFYYWLGTQYYGESHSWLLHDVAVDRSGNVWLAWDGADSAYESGPLYNWSTSSEYYYVGRHGGDSVSVGQQVSLVTDGQGDVHALAYSDGKARDVRFDGASGIQESEALIAGASGELLAVSGTGESTMVAGAGSIAQSSPWAMSVAVDGLLSAGSGIRLGDGTLVNSGGDIAALGPLQSSAGGGYFLSGNLGLGTNASSFRLDVGGDARVSGAASLLGNVTIGGDLEVGGGIVAGGTARALPAGDIPMGSFTNGPAQ